MASQASFDPLPVTLEGKIVRLEPLILEHAAGMLAAGSAESIWQFLAVPAPADLDQARKWIQGRLADQEAERRIPYAVICLADGKFAGSTGYAAIAEKLSATKPHRQWSVSRHPGRGGGEVQRLADYRQARSRAGP